MTTITQANRNFKQGNYKQAEHEFRQLLTANPNDINALWGLGKIALIFDRYQMAYTRFKQCLVIHNKEPRLWLSLAQACQKLMKFEAAQNALLNAYQLNSSYQPSLFALAIYYCEAGEYQQAEHYIRSILITDPENISAFTLLVRINKVALNEALSQTMLAKLTLNKSDEKANLSKQNQVALHYAFFTLYDQEQHYEQAFEHLKAANKLQYAAAGFTVDDMQTFFNDLMSSFDKTSTNKISKTTDNKPKVIFIVSQPRSGSTLLEQMLMGHSAIKSAGELPFLAGDIAQGIFQLTGQYFPQGAKLLSAEHCQHLAKHYMELIQQIAPNSEYIIDKMPANFQSVGLINQLMPEAKIIHISREPVDVCWSIYKNNFSASEPYFSSLPDIIKYHQNYQKVMQHWQKILPEFIHNISYEELVNAPEKEIAKVLEFCGLTFEPSCLAFHQQKRHIATLSDTQLRTGIKKGQNQAWLPYKNHLSSLLQTFKN